MSKLIRWIIRLPVLIAFGVLVSPAFLIGWAFDKEFSLNDIKSTWWYRSFKP